MKKIISLWEDYLAVEASLASSSVKAYSADVRDFAYYLREEKNVILPANIQPDHLLDYLGLLNDIGAQPATLSRRCSSISVFLTYLQDEQFIDENPIHEVPKPDTGSILPKILSSDQVDELLNAPDSSDRYGVRDRALLELLYATGCRVSEIATLRQSFVDLEQRTLRVIGKGRKEREIPFSKRAKKWLAKYLHEVRPEQSSSENSPYLFLSQKGGALRRETIWRLVKQYARRTSIPQDMVHPHVFRHSIATHMLQNGTNLRIVQTILGHANISTTEVYTHLDIQQLKNQHDSFHPRKNMET